MEKNTKLDLYLLDKLSKCRIKIETSYISVYTKT